MRQVARLPFDHAAQPPTFAGIRSGSVSQQMCCITHGRQWIALFVRESCQKDVFSTIRVPQLRLCVGALCHIAQAANECIVVLADARTEVSEHFDGPERTVFTRCSRNETCTGSPEASRD